MTNTHTHIEHTKKKNPLWKWSVFITAGSQAVDKIFAEKMALNKTGNSGIEMNILEFNLQCVYSYSTKCEHNNQWQEKCK